jgi:lipopolysaccharide/colanic/teichoic acid biosynthesis glycosyltransferase
MKSFHEVIKRLFDIVFSVAGLIIAMPLFVIIAILIKADSKGPVLFRQGRIGLNRSPYNIYKFRSMIVGAEHTGSGLFNYENDPRVTRVGAVLRNTSLDEIPQFINILKGDMSFVGPRPPVTYELGDLDKLTPEFKSRFDIKPGVTGLAQVSGRNELSWDEKVAFDNRYIALFNKWGILIDIKLILLTIVKVIKNEGSYENVENVEKDKRRINKKD